MTETVRAEGVHVATGVTRPASRVALACVCQWLIPGSGYLLLGARWRALVAFLAIPLMALWGLALGGELHPLFAAELIGRLKTFAGFGLGAIYFAVGSFGSFSGGVGDITRASQEYGDTFLWSAGLMAYLLVLDVFDVGVGRKP